jgi:hypothetical protein
MSKKPHQTKELVALKSFFGKYTNRITISSRNVGSKKLTRPQIVKGLWTYIKAKKCQDTKNKRLINPDDKLSEVLGKKPVDMLKLAGLISKHIIA